ncbi:hypothetical protein AVEN_2610-1 [Araneus ventricosus]|uniref:Uncharacterized protein n=1 Tax=Araneus ventricosus TaxID=182803 RepID=A0A4Y2WJF5_ARAVE|nr:hypothetical protein AVEN_2610-1 [Araneus ventricosus]
MEFSETFRRALMAIYDAENVKESPLLKAWNMFPEKMGTLYRKNSMKVNFNYGGRGILERGWSFAGELWDIGWRRFRLFGKAFMLLMWLVLGCKSQLRSP